MLNGIFREYKGAFKMLGLLILTLILCRLTKGAFVGIVAAYGVFQMTKNKVGMALLCYMLIPFLIILNPSLVRGGLFALASRLSMVGMAVFIALHAMNRRGRHTLPMGLLYLYLVVALISSIGGWFPMISYFKVINFFLFFIGVHVGTKNIHQYPEQMTVLRNGLLAYAMLLIFGSIATFPFPSIGYAMAISNMSIYTGGDLETATDAILNSSGIKLFSGVTSHSQILGQMVVAMTAWVLCDMFLCEKRLSRLHVALVAAAPVLLYMSRSRMALLGFVFAVSLVYFYAVPKVNVPRRVKIKLRSVFTGMVIVGLIGAVIGEVTDRKITKWLRKTEDVTADTRDLGEAVTASRQGTIEANMYDFRKNPLLGMGFQTCEAHQTLYALGRINKFSAPIEKGLLPLMVLGETGVVGGFVFFIYLLVFFTTCQKRKYIATATMVGVQLFLNMAEASYFSPGGLGGAIWIACTVGGFVIDMAVVADKNRQSRMMVWNFAPPWVR